MFGFEYVTRHGRGTSEQPELDDNCPMADVLYALCRTKAMAVAVSRCEDFVQVRRSEA